MSNTCKSCGFTLEISSAKFCPECGKPINRPSTVYGLGVLLLGLVLGWIVWEIQESQAGVKPTKEFTRVPHLSSESEKSLFRHDDAELIELRKAVLSSPKDVNALRNLATALEKFYFSYTPGKDQAPSSLALEYLRTLSRIVELDPEQSETILKLAQVAFENKVFDQSATLYKRYLNSFPDNNDVRSKYASALAFTGRLEESREELEVVLSKDAEHFQANAFMSIALAQEGNNKAALEYGKKALKVAPNEEARKRFELFVSKLEAPSESPLLDYLKSNSITSDKFVSMKTENSVVTLVFKDFPMSAMPPVAKEKFYSSIRSNLNDIEWSKVQFVDFESGEVLGSFEK